MAGQPTGTLAKTCFAAAVGALGLAAPVSADAQPLNGTYMIEPGVDDVSWEIASNCATDGCQARISSPRGWSTIATMTGGRWNFTVTKPDGVVCGDGSYAPVIILYSIDGATLGGYLTTDSNGECPGGQITQAPFVLTKVG
jgi:hypothetical protein